MMGIFTNEFNEYPVEYPLSFQAGFGQQRKSLALRKGEIGPNWKEFLWMKLDLMDLYMDF